MHFSVQKVLSLGMTVMTGLTGKTGEFFAESAQITSRERIDSFNKLTVVRDRAGLAGLAMDRQEISMVNTHHARYTSVSSHQGMV